MQENKGDTTLDLRSIREERVYRLEHEKFRFYEPNGRCEEFIKKVGSLGDNGESNFVVLFSAANGVGKTAAGANVVANILWGKDSKNPYFDLPLFKDWPFPKKGRIASDPENLKGNLIATLKEWFPLGRYHTSKAGKQYESQWKTDTGFEFDIMSYEQDAKEYESATLGWAWFDEPPLESIFKATVGRMRKGGIIFITETPLWAAWLYDHIIANPDQELATKGQRVYVEAQVEDACKEHGVRGHLEHDHIMRMVAEYSEDEKQARVYGKFQHLVGLRYKQFSRNIHVIRPFEITQEDWIVYHALDTHPRNNDAGTWLAINKDGRKIIVDEFWEKCQGGTEEMAQRIKKKNENYRIEKMLLEPAAYNEDQHQDNPEMTLAKKLVGYGLLYLPATKNRTMSDKRIEDALTYQKLNINGVEEFIKAPELFIFDNCQRTIYEFEHLRWQEWSGKAGEQHNQKEKAMDKDDHFIENIGRILIQEPKFVPMPLIGQGFSENPNYDPYS